MQKFTINEDDQFDIFQIRWLCYKLDAKKHNSRIHDLLEPNESLKPKAGNKKIRLRREEIRAQLDVLRGCSGIVDIFFFGFFEYKRVEDQKYTIKPRSLAIKYIIKKSIENLSTSQFKFSRISVIDIRHAKLWGQRLVRDKNGRTGMS